MTICAVIWCNTRSECIKDTNISLHKFPKAPEILDAWIKAVGRLNWHPTKHSVICSKHFEENCFIKGYKIVKLHKNAIPTRFPSCPSLQSQKEKEAANLVTENAAPFENFKTPNITGYINENRDEVDDRISLQRKLVHQKETENLVIENAQRVPFENVENLINSWSRTKNVSRYTNKNHDEVDDRVSLKRKLVQQKETENLVIENAQRVPFENVENFNDSWTKTQNVSRYTNKNHDEVDDRVSLKRKLVQQKEIENLVIEKAQRVPLENVENLNVSWTRTENVSRYTSKNHDDDDDDRNSLKRKLNVLSHRYEMAKKKIRRQQNKRRREKHIVNLEAVIGELKSKNFMHEDNLDILRKVPGPNNEFLARQLAKELGTSHAKQYSPELRSFAVTLHYFSPRAYNYVRNVFNKCLPCERTIKQWYKAIDGKPGFTLEAFEVLEEICKVPDNVYLWNMIIDEMSIRKFLEYDGKYYYGYTDFGGVGNNDSVTVAKGALTFMLVGINTNWKLPIAYFFIDGINSIEQADLAKQALILSFEAGATIVNITFDGTITNRSMAENLGCNFSITNMITNFMHPLSSEPVSVMLDACHMVKLVRNTLSEKGCMIDKDGGLIKWYYVEQLYYLQEREGVHLANKLRKSHVHWATQKMKVKLAVQTFSASVADAIEFCKNIGLDEFLGSEATVNFIRIVNTLFDVLNSRNMLQQNWKKPIYDGNYVKTLSFLNETCEYIEELNDDKGERITSSNRKVGFLGLIICIRSTIDLYGRLVIRHGLIYLPLYKFTQDHLEIFFSSIRSQGGWNNNPTARQFTSAYKKLLIHCELFEDSRGNCLKLENIPILHASSSQLSPENAINISCSRARVGENPLANERTENLSDELVFLNSVIDHDYPFDVEKLTLTCRLIVAHIAGFIVRKLEAKLSCESCINALKETKPKKDHAFIQLKDLGGLKYPATDVMEVCFTSEKIFRKNVSRKASENSSMNVAVSNMISEVLQHFIGKPIFDSLNDHVLEHDRIYNHAIQLLKAIAEKYLNIRLKYWCKQYSSNIIDHKKRQLFTKLILFRGE